MAVGLGLSSRNGCLIFAMDLFGAEKHCQYCLFILFVCVLWFNLLVHESRHRKQNGDVRLFTTDL